MGRAVGGQLTAWFREDRNANGDAAREEGMEIREGAKDTEAGKGVGGRGCVREEDVSCLRGRVCWKMTPVSVSCKPEADARLSVVVD
eukprot:158306-Rhodomonas_salina.3